MTVTSLKRDVLILNDVEDNTYFRIHVYAMTRTREISYLRVAMFYFVYLFKRRWLQVLHSFPKIFRRISKIIRILSAVVLRFTIISENIRRLPSSQSEASTSHIPFFAAFSGKAATFGQYLVRHRTQGQNKTLPGWAWHFWNQRLEKRFLLLMTKKWKKGTGNIP